MRFLIGFLLLLCTSGFSDPPSHFAETPVLYQGRVVPIEAYAQRAQNCCSELLWKEMLKDKTQLTQLFLLPIKNKSDWAPLILLELNENFTPFSSQQFNSLRCYFNQALDDPEHHFNQLFSLLYDSYTSLDNPSFPSLLQLKVEKFYVQLPFKGALLSLYIFSLILLIAARLLKKPILRAPALGIAALGFSLHCLLLLMRIYILQRPPVTSMYETLLFVSWVMMLGGLLLTLFYKISAPLLVGLSSASVIFACSLFMQDNLGVLPPVLNSHTWLMVHVLTVTSSYGCFLISSALSHWFLLRKNSEGILPRWIMHMNFSGLFFLVTGTILGAIWADMSWGRLWDWDPKETWAFIAICAYLILIHAYHAKKLSSWGIAFGSCLASLFITFNWYGVNYILGKGLHSYGFGQGSPLFYYIYLFTEMAFLSGVLFMRLRKAA